MRRRLSAGPPAQLLCVDDDHAARQFYQRVLESHGYRVLLAQSGADALRLLRRHLVSLVLSDFEMPGMSGGELAAEIKRRRPRVRVVLLSGKEAVVENPPEWVDGALSKSAPLERLLELIKTVRHAPRARSLRSRGLQPLVPLGEALAGVALVAFLLPRVLK